MGIKTLTLDLDVGPRLHSVVRPSSNVETSGTAMAGTRRAAGYLTWSLLLRHSHKTLATQRQQRHVVPAACQNVRYIRASVNGRGTRTGAGAGAGVGIGMGNTSSTISSSSSTSLRRASTKAKASDEEEGHEVPDTVIMDVDEERMLQAFQKHQSKAKKLPFPQESRTLVDIGRYGVLSTLSEDGFPSGSIVGYAAKKENGLPIFVFSTMSSHTGEIDRDCRCSLTVTAPGFKGAADGRVSIMGKVYKVSEEEEEERIAELREEYKAKHPNAFWVDFGDFSVYEMTELVQVRLVGGFARAGSINPKAFMSAEVDGMVQFSEPICKHMNDDHVEQIPIYVKHYTGLTVDSAKMLSIDHIGMNVEANRDGQTFKVRLPYPEPAKDRKGIKDQIVTMSKAARSAAEASPSS